jgi:hypothetical protein
LAAPARFRTRTACLGAFLMIAAGALAPALALAQTTAGQPTPASPSPHPDQKPETVIVTGQRPNETIDAVVSQFVALHAAKNRKTGLYMRDDVGPVCPFTQGLPAAFDAFVTARVLAVAKSAGAKTDAGSTCKPNVEILFTDRPGEVVKSLADRTRGAILGVHFVHERRSLLTVTHPIQAWYVTGTRYDEAAITPVLFAGRDGNVTQADDPSPKLDDAYHAAPDRFILGSHIAMRRVSSIMNALIVADTKVLAGHEIGPVSDYIAMIALSQPRSLDECNELPSILDLMSSDCEGRAKPAALTAGDRAYLKGLYAADLGATTDSVQKDNIANGMKTNLDPQ